MATKRQRHTRKYKIEAVRLASTSDKPVSVVADELGIRADALYRWKREFEIEPTEAFRGDDVLCGPDEEIARLRRELKRVTDERDFLKKNGDVLRQGKQVRTGCIRAHETEFDVRMMCRVLNVSVSGNYRWRDRPPAARSQHDARLPLQLQEHHRKSRQTCGRCGCGRRFGSAIFV